MRDADKILERGVVRVSTGQARALVVGAVGVVVLAFVAGLQVGRVAGAVTAARSDSAEVAAGAGEGVAAAVERRQPVAGGLGDGPGRGAFAAALAAEAASSPAPAAAPESEVPPPTRSSPELSPAPPPRSDAKASPIPASLGAPTVPWEVQLASYPDPSQADAAIAELGRKGVDAVRREATVGGALWYRVRVGPFSSQEEARRRSLEIRSVSPYPPIVTRGD